MLFFSLPEALLIAAAAIAVDLIVGDPARLPHPVVWIGRLIRRLERLLAGGRLDRPIEARTADRRRERLGGVLLAALTVGIAFAATWAVCAVCARLHPWLGWAAQVWFVSTTIAVKGLKQAALDVYRPLAEGWIGEAREMVGRIVGRDTDRLDEPEIARAAVETVAENTVDAVVSPAFYALLGGAPLAMLYRAANTLDSMVGYKNDRYLHFGWASARWDDVMNWIPARLTGLLLAAVALAAPGLSARDALRSVRRFAHLHPSPNSGIPESAVAGALGVTLGGTNYYGGRIRERARMGFGRHPLEDADILRANRMMAAVGYTLMGGLGCAEWLLLG